MDGAIDGAIDGEILKRLDQIQRDIAIIKQRLDLIEPQTQKMDRHVDFVNDVYSSVKKPFHFICHQANYLISGSSSSDSENSVPQICD